MFNVWKIGDAKTSEKTYLQLKEFISQLLSEPTETKPEIEKIEPLDFELFSKGSSVYDDYLCQKINEIIEKFNIYLSTKDKKETTWAQMI